MSKSAPINQQDLFLSAASHSEQVYPALEARPSIIQVYNATHAAIKEEADVKEESVDQPWPGKKGPIYAVRRGRIPGIYDSLEGLNEQVRGFEGAQFRPVSSYEAALEYINARPEDEILPRKRRRETSSPETDPDTGEQASPNGPDSNELSDLPTLTEEQRAVLDRVLDGKSCFFTGSAGTGKSVLLRAITRALSGRFRPSADTTPQQRQGRRREEVPVIIHKFGLTASTGMAGVNIGGTTLHHWAGIGQGEGTVEQLRSEVFRRGQALLRWWSTDVLIIDEISMISAELFDKLNWLAKELRKSHEPFGGLQIVASGDFLQLPPIGHDGSVFDPRFCFESPAWQEVFGDNVTVLSRVFRQTDQRFIAILESVRLGALSPRDARRLAVCDRSIAYQDGIEPICLFPIKVQVEQHNETRLNALSGRDYICLASDTAGKDSEGHNLSEYEATTRLNRKVSWPSRLRLRVGAQVMLLQNMQQNYLVNGSSGRVVSFGTATQARLQGVLITEASKRALDSLDGGLSWPVVRFARPRHLDPKANFNPLVLVPQMVIETTNAQHQLEAARAQVPLMLAWALTIHKAQGQTLERVKVDLQKVFTSGQIYVALSRAVSLETLEILNLDPSKVKAHPTVLRWVTQVEEQHRRTALAETDTDGGCGEKRAQAEDMN